MGDSGEANSLFKPPAEKKKDRMEGEGQEDAAITGARLAHVHREKRKTMASDSNTIASLEGSHYQVTGKYQRGHIGSVVAATDPGGVGVEV